MEKLFYFILFFSISSFNLKGEVIYPQSLNKSIIDPGVYQDIRGGLSNSYLCFTINKTGRVAFLGGSITDMKGWRDKFAST
jgi:sialidase-1